MIVVVTGPPCAGKSTHVADRVAQGGDRDVVLDLDAIAHALGYPAEHLEWGDRHPAREAALVARASLLKLVRSGTLDAPRVWVIDAAGAVLASLASTRTPYRLVELDPGRDVCLERAAHAGRSRPTFDEIHRWYDGRADGATSLGRVSQEW